MASRFLVAATVTITLPVSGLSGGEVAIEGVHICCGACIKAMTAALAEVEGVSDPRFNRDEQSMTFSAGNRPAARSGMSTLLHAGFGGEFTHDGKKLTPALPKIKTGTKSDRITFSGVHLCCSWCYEDAVGSLEDVDGVTKAVIVKRAQKTPQKTIVVTGKAIDLLEARRALLGAGLYGKME